MQIGGKNLPKILQESAINDVCITGAASVLPCPHEVLRQTALQVLQHKLRKHALIL